LTTGPSTRAPTTTRPWRAPRGVGTRALPPTMMRHQPPQLGTCARRVRPEARPRVATSSSQPRTRAPTTTRPRRAPRGMHSSAASDEATAPTARHVRGASAARGMAKGGYIVDGTSDEGSDDDEAEASAARRTTYVASAASEDDEAVSTAERRACAAMAARHADGGRLRQHRPSRHEATASAARRRRTTKAARRTGVNEAASDAKGDDVGAREASPIPSCKGGASAAPWGARKASPIPYCEGGASGIIFLSIM